MISFATTVNASPTIFSVMGFQTVSTGVMKFPAQLQVILVRNQFCSNVRWTQIYTMDSWFLDVVLQLLLQLCAHYFMIIINFEISFQILVEKQTNVEI